MNRHVLTRGLTWCVVAIILLPVLLAVVLGLGGLLAALGDSVAAAACGRVALALGVLLVAAVIGTTVVNALTLLAPPRRRRRRPARRRRPPDDRVPPQRIAGAP